MRTIQVLDEKTIDRIAAGEVVERPASVVKELVENAIDALATAITVEIKEGGISLIRVTDNGSGIPADQVRTAFLRHATSKLRSVEELTYIASLGFRGEALSSIAAVAQVELITKTMDSLTGIRYRIEGGVEKDFEEIGAPQGTTFLVHHLFFNTPARAKFLKSQAAEGNQVTTVVEQLALSHPEISFKYILNGQNKLYTSGNGNLKEVVYQIYGRDLTKELVEVEHTTPFMKITGFIGRSTVARGNRNFENYFVNGRYVKSKLLAKGIEDGYRGFMMQHRYPFTLLYFEIDGEKVDVNVHPSKMELRFSAQEEIYQALCLAVKNALLTGDRVSKVSLQEAAEEEKSPVKKEEKLIFPKAPEPFEIERRKSIDAAPKRPVEVSHVAEEKPVYKAEKPAPKAEKPRQLDLFDEKIVAKDQKSNIRIVGQVFDTYYIMQHEDSMYIVDQHAAHEKVLYERMMRDFKNKQILSQMVSPPVIISLSSKEHDLLKNYLSYFLDLGYEIEPFGGKEYKICGVPSNLYGLDARQLFTEILDSLQEMGHASPVSIMEKLASMSCKAAVKGNQRMSAYEMQELIAEMLTLDNPFHCPHGRPTVIAMTKNELDKKFKRII